MGSANTVYVSLPSANSNCSDLGLPSLPAGWSYHCSNSTNLQKTDSTGWIPINFTQISFGNVLQSLPVDPINTTSTGNYYIYVTGGSYQLATLFESEKYNSELTSQYYTIGTATNLIPTVTLVASSTGVTMNLSTANGYAFITSSSLNLTPYINRYVIISDGTNNIQGFIKAQGSGETYGSELMSNSDMESSSNWSAFAAAGNYSTTKAYAGTRSWATTATVTYRGISGSVSTTAGKLYLGSAWYYSDTYSSTMRMSIGGASYSGALVIKDTSITAGSWQQGLQTKKTAVFDGTATYIYETQGSNSVIYIDNVSLKQILTPSISGVTITNTRGGSTYNWVTNSGINPNAASFTVTVSI